MPYSRDWGEPPDILAESLGRVFTSRDGPAQTHPLRGTGLSSWVPVLAELLSRVSCRISGPTSYLAEILGRVQVCVRLSVALPGDCPRLA